MNGANESPSREVAENGAEPEDALYIDRGFLPDPPEVADPLDTAYGAAQVRQWLAEALGEFRGRAEAGPEPEPEASSL